MLTDTAVKALKAKPKLYKVSDRDGMYVAVQPSGAIVFRYDYRLNGRRETLTLGRYGPEGLSLARAREKLIDARRAISEGRSPAREKQHEKRRLKEAKKFGEFGEKWFQESRMADSTRAMRRSIYERDILPMFRNRLLTEIAPDDLRVMCGKVKDRDAPATAVHVRDIVKLIFAFAILHGEKVANPADEVGPASIATFVPKDRSLSPAEIRVMLGRLEHVPTLPTIRLGMKLFLLTMVRKSELQDATWDEVDFENAVWSIPKERMKRSKAHNVYLSEQAVDIFIALKTCAGNEQPRHADIKDGMIEPGRLSPEGAGQPRLAGAGLPVEDQVFVGLQPLSLRQRQHLTSIETAGGGEVDVLDGSVGKAELGEPKAVGQPLVGANGRLAIEHETQPFVTCKLARSRLLAQIAIGARHSGKAEGLHLVDGRMVQHERMSLHH